MDTRGNLCTERAVCTSQKAASEVDSLSVSGAGLGGVGGGHHKDEARSQELSLKGQVCQHRYNFF